MNGFSEDTPAEAPPAQGLRISKLERALGLCVALNAHPHGLTREEISRTVPGYEGLSDEAMRKSLERDRASLELAGLRFAEDSIGAVDFRYKMLSAPSSPSLSLEERLAVRLASLALGRSSVAGAVGMAADRLLLAGAQSGLDASLEVWRPLLPDDAGLLDQVCRAVADAYAVSFVYVNASGERSRRIVWPWAVFPLGDSWGLIGYCERRRHARMFKFSRMSQVETLAPDAMHFDPVPLSERAVQIEKIWEQVPRFDGGDFFVLAPADPPVWIQEQCLAQEELPVGDAFAGESWKRYRLPSPRREALAWMLTDEGQSVPLAPSELGEAFDYSLDRILQAHENLPDAPEQLPKAKKRRQSLSQEGRIHRLFSVLGALSHGQWSSVGELATLLAMKPEIVLQDLYTLTVAGPEFDVCSLVDIQLEEHESGKPEQAQARLIEGQGFEEAPVPPTADLLPLIASLRHCARILGEGSRLGAAVESAIAKLLSSTDRPEIAAALVAGSSVPLQLSFEAAQILQAMEKGLGVAFRYARPGQNRAEDRLLWPRGVFEENGRIYLVGWEIKIEENGPVLKAFRLDRLFGVRQTELSSASRHVLSSPLPESVRWGARQKGEGTFEAWVAFADSEESSAQESLTRFDARDPRLMDDGRIAARVTIHHDAFSAEVLTASGSMAVIAPAALRQRVLDAVTRMRNVSAKARRLK